MRPRSRGIDPALAAIALGIVIFAVRANGITSAPQLGHAAWSTLRLLAPGGGGQTGPLVVIEWVLLALAALLYALLLTKRVRHALAARRNRKDPAR